jgi:hypothetical protein
LLYYSNFTRHTSGTCVPFCKKICSFINRFSWSKRILVLLTDLSWNLMKSCQMEIIWHSSIVGLLDSYSWCLALPVGKDDKWNCAFFLRRGGKFREQSSDYIGTGFLLLWITNNIPLNVEIGMRSYNFS